jgi:hypothetical protein
MQTESRVKPVMQSQRRLDQRFLLVGLVLVVSSAALVVPTNAAVKAGGACKKVQQVKVVGNTSLKCLKVGKRLVWREVKSRPVIAPTVEVTPSPNPSPTPTPIPSPTRKPVSTIPSIGKGIGYVYRYDSGKQERLNFDGEWYSTDARTDDAFHEIRVAAYRSITSLPTDEDHKNIKFEYLIRPSYPTAIAEIIKKQSTDAARRLSPLLDRKLTIRLIMITEKDQDFIDQELSSMIPIDPKSFSFMKNYTALSSFYSMGGTGGGQAGFIEARDYGYYLAHTSSLAEPDTYWPEVPPHELAHVLQFFLARNSNSRFGEGHPEAKWHGHLVEGSANTLGMALGFETLGWYSDEMDRILRRNINTQRIGGSVPMETVEDAISLIKTIEKRDTEVGNEFSYSAGQIVWEYFIGKYGIEKFIDFLKNIPKTQNFNENLKTTIGLDRDSFYREAGKYLLDTWKRLSKV